MKHFFFALTLFTLSACGSSTVDESETAPVTQTTPTRVEAAADRLNDTEPGRLVWSAIEAHGGLENWYAKSPLEYHFNYQPVGDGAVRNTMILNDYRSARAVHTTVDPEGMRFGFDGEHAWRFPAGEESGMNPRFWSLTPYYFVGLPFVLADAGINFAFLPDTQLLDGTTYRPVKVTYEAGMGDAPDDYYILYINPTTKRLDALNYIVSYPGFFKEGEHTPEKLMFINDYVTVEGMVLPTGYTTRWSDTPDEVITNIEISDYRFRPNVEETAFEMPEGGEIVEKM